MAKKRRVNPMLADPTRTSALRKRFMQDMGARFRRLRGAVYKLVVVEDAFGLRQPRTPGVLRLNGLVINTRWKFLTDAEKVKKYQSWFKLQVEAGILELENGADPAEPWTQEYVQSAYTKGATRAWKDTHQEALAAGMPTDVYDGGAKQFIGDAFGGKVKTSKIELLANRSFEQLKGVTAAMGQEMNRVLSTSIANGTSVEKIAKELNETISTMTKKRAMTIARTEIIHAHAEGQLDSFEKMNIEEVGVLAEWSTAGDGKVCPLCNAINGAIMTIKEARGLLPRHPNCRCAWIPAGVGEPVAGQKWAKDVIDAQVMDSMKKETGEKAGAAARKKSKWAAADKKFSDKKKLKPTKANLAEAKKKLDSKKKAAAVAAQKRIEAKKAELAAAQAAQVAKKKAALAAAKKKKAADEALHLKKQAASGWKFQYKSEYGLTEADFYVPHGGDVIALKPLAKVKVFKQDFGVSYPDTAGLIPQVEMAATLDKAGDLLDFVGAYKKAKPGMAARAKLYDEWGFPYKTDIPALSKLVGEDGALTEKGVAHVFDVIGGKPKGTLIKHIASNDFDLQLEQITSISKVNKAAEVKKQQKAAAIAAKKAEHSFKVKQGMAKKKYAKPENGGVHQSQFTEVDGKVKMDSDGVAAVLKAKGYSPGDLPYDQVVEIFIADDIVQQTALLNKIPKKAQDAFKVKQGLAKKKYAVPDNGGVTPDLFIEEGGKVKIHMNGISSILKSKGYAPGELPWKQVSAIMDATDIVKQDALLAKIPQKKAPKAAKGAAKATTKKATTATLPSPAELTHVKTLPGSTSPSLTVDKAGKQWVVKDTSANLKPAHIKSEALADDLYGRAGVAVPKSGIVKTAEGPSKVAEFLEGGETLAEWRAGKTAAQIKAMDKKIADDFVMDALLANHDVVGLSNDNILIVKGKPFRIDNGGAMAFRAQGGKKQGWGPIVQELESMRDPAINANTAKVFGSLKDVDIHKQIEKVLTHRAAILDGIADKKLRGTIEARMDYLSSLLPRANKATKSQTGKAALYAVDDEAADHIRGARLNGRTLSGDTDKIEDNNILVWEEVGVDGKPVTKVHFKVTQKGSEAIEKGLGDTLANATQPVSGSGLNLHPKDTFWEQLQKGIKTVSHHAGDGAYNSAVLEQVASVKRFLLDKVIHRPDQKAMAEHYLKMIDAIEAAKAKGVAVPLQKPYIMPKAKKKAVDVSSGYHATKVSKVQFPTKNIQKGKAEVLPGTGNTFNGDGYVVKAGDDVEFFFAPNDGTFSERNGLAFNGTVELTVPGEVTPATIKKALSTVDTLGIPTKAASADYEELLYLHRSINLRGGRKAAYKKIIENTDLSDAEKVVQVKAWASKRFDVDFDELKKKGLYNPQGVAKTSFGDGMRYWERWDITPEEIKDQMGKYHLVHRSSSLEDALEGMLNSGGETTTTVGRVRKGVNVQSTGGMSSSSDVHTGGASYFFTRIEKKTKLGEGLAFKIEKLARQDAISYSSDKYGRISALSTRGTDIDDYKDFAKNGSNETLFKEGLSLIDDIETIGTSSAAQRKRIIKLFKDHKMGVLPDGRKIEDVVK